MIYLKFLLSILLAWLKSSFEMTIQTSTGWASALCPIWVISLVWPLPTFLVSSLVFHPQLILQQKLNYLELHPTLFHASVLLFLVNCLIPPPPSHQWANLTRLTPVQAFGKALSSLQHPPWPQQAEVGAPLMDVIGGIYYIVVETGCLPTSYLDLNYLAGKDFFQSTLCLYCPAQCLTQIRCLININLVEANSYSLSFITIFFYYLLSVPLVLAVLKYTTNRESWFCWGLV